MSERFETKRCINALYKYSSFPFSFYITAYRMWQKKIDPLGFAIFSAAAWNFKESEILLSYFSFCVYLHARQNLIIFNKSKTTDFWLDHSEFRAVKNLCTEILPLCQNNDYHQQCLSISTQNFPHFQYCLLQTALTSVWWHTLSVASPNMMSTSRVFKMLMNWLFGNAWNLL